jgi:Protein of unknown function (DUF3795)
MSERLVKKYPTLGCCGLDCGLCPRYYSVGPSRCPGCAGLDFFNKHPSCSYITCCVKKKGLEVCAECDEFPCPKFTSWLDKLTIEDSFLTHQKIRSNLYFIKQQGLDKFLKQQKKRIKLLEKMLKDFDEGRSKSFYCIASTLLPVAELETLIDEAEHKIKVEKVRADDTKTKAKILKELLSSFAAKGGVELKLRHKERRT